AQSLNDSLDKASGSKPGRTPEATITLEIILARFGNSLMEAETSGRATLTIPLVGEPGSAVTYSQILALPECFGPLKPIFRSPTSGRTTLGSGGGSRGILLDMPRRAKARTSMPMCGTNQSAESIPLVYVQVRASVPVSAARRQPLLAKRAESSRRQ